MRLNVLRRQRYISALKCCTVSIVTRGNEPCEVRGLGGCLDNAGDVNGIVLVKVPTRVELNRGAGILATAVEAWR